MWKGYRTPSICQWLTNQGSHFPFPLIQVRIKGWMKTWNEKAAFQSCKKTIQGILPLDQSFFKVVPYSTSYLYKRYVHLVCACLSACCPLGLSNVQSGWYLSPCWNKSVNCGCSYVICVWVRAEPTERQRFPSDSCVRWRVNSCRPQMFFVFIFLIYNCGQDNIDQNKFMAILLFYVKWMAPSIYCSTLLALKILEILKKNSLSNNC